MFGILSALGAASSWTYACYLWRQQTKYFSASQINITKNIIAFIIFSPVILTFDFQSSFNEIFVLLLSGIIGISLGDTFYIISLTLDWTSKVKMTGKNIIKAIIFLIIFICTAEKYLVCFLHK